MSLYILQECSSPSPESASVDVQTQMTVLSTNYSDVASKMSHQFYYQSLQVFLVVKVVLNGVMSELRFKYDGVCTELQGSRLGFNVCVAPSSVKLSQGGCKKFV